MAVPSSIDDLSPTAASNGPDGSVDLPSAYDEYLRAHASFIRRIRDGFEFPPMLSSVSGADTITATAPSVFTAYATGQRFSFVAAGANTGAVTLNINSIGANAVTKRGATALVAGDIASGAVCVVVYDGTQFQLVNVIGVSRSGDETIDGVKTFSSSPVVPTATTATQAVNKGQIDAIYRGLVRQSVQSGPVDSNGLPNFGGSTGSTTVTAAGTLVVAAAGGYGASGAVDRVGATTNPSWTGLSTNGTMYLYVDVAADGTCTTGSTTLSPVYQDGGTYSTTNGQFTFNISEMIGTVGDGSAANQTYRVFVGEVTVAGGVVSAITWYALRGQYQSGLQTVTALTLVSVNHNIGVTPRYVRTVLVNQTTEYGYAEGDEVDLVSVANIGSGTNHGLSIRIRPNSIGIATGNGISIVRADTGAVAALTLNRWKTRSYVQRGWL